MRSSPFDDDDGTREEAPQSSTNSLWRRPWWRWNLFTLFAVLFVYVWVRELLSWTAGITILGLMAILGVWIIIPFVPCFLDSGLKLLTFTTEVVKKYHEKPKQPKSFLILAARWLAVLSLVAAMVDLIRSIYTLISMNLRYSGVFTEYISGMGLIQILFYFISVALGIVPQLAIAIVLWMLADILQNQEEMKSKQEEPK